MPDITNEPAVDAPSDQQPNQGENTQQPDGSHQEVQNQAEQEAQQPISYQDFQVPEGVDVQGDALNNFKQMAAEAGLTQEQAQKFVNIGVQMQQQWADEQSSAIKAAGEQWAQLSQKDSEFGGQVLEENLGVAKQALDKFGTPELKQLLNDSGFGNHPEVIRVFYRVGKAISNDKFVGGGQGAAQPRDPASILFPNQS